tara:strand:- start:8 stop:463 length:456 start_codon:yes stop_codon:yes gene_type:complete
MNASGPAATPTHVSHNGFSMAETTAIAMLASTAVGAILGLITVTVVLVVVTKQLERLVRVLRGEASVHTGLLACANCAPPPDAFAGPSASSNGGVTVSMSSSSSSGKSILKKPIARLPSLTKHEKSRHPKTDENNTSCAIAEVDEEDDHTL